MHEPVISVISAFMIGLLGSVHCVGMCGGIVNALSFAIPDSQGRASRWNLLLFYNLGRVASYTVAGVLVGGLGLLLQGPAGILGPGLRIAAGLMLIAMGLYMAGWWFGLTRLEQLGNHLVWRHIQPLTTRLMPVSRPGQALILGALWGWLPCGLVYSTLTLAGALADWTQSMLVMASFGLGTVPVLLLTGAFAGTVKTWLHKSIVRLLAALLMCLFGIWTLTPPLLHMLARHSH